MHLHRREDDRGKKLMSHGLNRLSASISEVQYVQVLLFHLLIAPL